MSSCRKSPAEDQVLDIDVAAALTSLKSTSPSAAPGGDGVDGSVAPPTGIPGSAAAATGNAAFGHGCARKDKFPVKLMEILSNDEYADCVTWMPHGRSFIFTSPEKFTRDVLPKYFRGCKYSSFTRKLYRWGFRQISKGPDAESFFHKHFRRDKKTLCQMITCGKEIRDGCPELHCGISAASLLRHEQMEIREEMMQMRSRHMREAVFARQQMQQRMGMVPPGAMVGMAGAGVGVGAGAGAGAGGPLPLPMASQMRFEREGLGQPSGPGLGGGVGVGGMPPPLQQPIPMPSSLQGMAVSSADEYMPYSDMQQLRMMDLKRREFEQAMYYNRTAGELGQFDGMTLAGSNVPGMSMPADPRNLQLLAQSRQQQLRPPYDSTDSLGVMLPHQNLQQIQKNAPSGSPAIRPRQESINAMKSQHPPLYRQSQAQPPDILPKAPLPPVAEMTKTSATEPPQSSLKVPPEHFESMDAYLQSRKATAAALETAVEQSAATGDNAGAGDKAGPGGDSSVVANGVIRRAIDALRGSF